MYYLMSMNDPLSISGDHLTRVLKLMLDLYPIFRGAGAMAGVVTAIVRNAGFRQLRDVRRGLRGVTEGLRGQVKSYFK
jgi:hypothetical protein